MNDQLELFDWIPPRPANVIDARSRFQDRAFQWLQKAIATGRLPPQVDGKIITIPKRGAA